MSLVKRAWWSVWNNRWRTLVLLLMLSVISTLVLVSLSLYHSTVQAEKNARSTLGSEVRLEYDYEKSLNRSEEENRKINTWPTIAMAQSLAHLSQVKDYNYLRPLAFIAGNFKAVENETMTEDVEITFDGPAFELENVSIYEVLNTALLKEFIDGTHTMISGRHITRDDTGQRLVLMESTLAEQNHLNIGDTIEVRTIITDEKEQFEIVGIYTTSKSAADAATTIVQTHEIPQNIMYGSFFDLGEGEQAGQAVTISKAMYYLEEPDQIPAFVKKAEALGTIDFDIYRLHTNQKALQTMTYAIEKVGSWSKVMLILVFTAGTIIMGLMLVLFIRLRKTEMGILLSLGEKRRNIVMQLFLETVILLIVSVLISVMSGSLMMGEVSDQLLSKQVESVENQQKTYTQGAKVFILQDDASEPIKQLNVQLTLPTILGLAGAGLLLTLIATIISAALILRLNPKAILADH